MLGSGDVFFCPGSLLARGVVPTVGFPMQCCAHTRERFGIWSGFAVDAEPTEATFEKRSAVGADLLSDGSRRLGMVCLEKVSRWL